jgi:type IV secretory pathway VirJ component
VPTAASRNLLHLLAHEPGLGQRLAALLEAPLAATAQDTLAGLPLIELPVATPGRSMAVVYSGDGGWRDIGKDIAGRLQADLVVHVTGWPGVENREGSLPTAPELARLALVQCFYGAEEPDTACTSPVMKGAQLIRTHGGHHFDGDYGRLADAILAGVAR